MTTPTVTFTKSAIGYDVVMDGTVVGRVWNTDPKSWWYSVTPEAAAAFMADRPWNPNPEQGVVRSFGGQTRREAARRVVAVATNA